jgi:hypothetical protein
MLRSIPALWLAVSISGCAHTSPWLLPAASDAFDCPRGTTRDEVRISDQGWDYPERVIQCLGEDRYAEGPAVEYYAGAEGRGPTKLVGRYAKSVQVGTWTQYDVKTGRILASFVLDANGSGTEDFRDQVGHRLVGRLSRGQRDGEWTFFDSSGTKVAVEVYSKGKWGKRSGTVPWDPPMLEDDACPTHAEDRRPGIDTDGCPGTQDRPLN